MADTLQDIMSYDEAHYFDIGTPESPDIQLGGVITQLDENSNPTESEKQYIHQKTKTTKVTGFADEFPITMDMVKGDKVLEHMYSIFRDRKTGTEAQVDHYIVELWNETATNTYKCRKQTQTVSIDSKTANPGEQINISGNLKAVSDFVDGTFNVSTKQFTPTENSNDDDLE